MAPIPNEMNREDVINKVFPHSLFGYDPVAVDAFLDEVIREFDRMTNTIDVLQFRLSQELGEAKETNDMLSAELRRVDYASRVEQLISGLPSGEKEAEAPFIPQEEGGEEFTEEELSEQLEFDPEAWVEEELPDPMAYADSAKEAFEQALECEKGEGGSAPVEEIRLMSRKEIRKMIRDEKKLERKVRKQKK